MALPRIMFLKEDEQVLVHAFTRRFVLNGPQTVFIRPHWRFEKRSAHTLEPTAYMLVRNKLTGELRNVLGPTLFFPNAEDEIIETRTIITLRKNQYIRILNEETGERRVVRGETTIYLEPTESLLGEVKTGINIDDDTAVLVRDVSSGQQQLITEKQVFIPTADQTIIESRNRIRLEDTEAIIIKDQEGRYSFRRGSDAERAFFLPPHHKILKLQWASGIHKDARSLIVSKLDLRPKYMWYEFEARTRDNVELILGVTFFWEITNLETMIATTDDTPGDICSHARSAIIQAVSQVTLETFLARFNDIVRTTILDGDTAFYEARGVTLHAVEVRSVQSKDASTQKVLLEIINETTNRINRLQKQESENEVKLKKVEGEIESESKRTDLLELRRKHAEIEGAITGENEAQRVITFMNSLGDNLTTEQKVSIFNTLRKQDALEALAAGNAHLIFTPDDVNLTIRTD